MMTDILHGLRISLQGLAKAWKSPKTRHAYLRLVFVVFGVAVVLDIIGGTLLWGLIEGWFSEVSIDALADTPEKDSALAKLKDAWSGTGGAVVAWTIKILFFLALMVIAPVIAFFLVNIFFPLFNDAIYMGALSEIDPELHAELAKSGGRGFFKNMRLTIGRMFLYLGASLLILLIGAIPVIGTLLAVPLQFCLTAHSLSWELLDPYFDRKLFAWPEQTQYLRGHRNMRLGFATPAALLMGIPLLGIAFFGLAQASVAGLTAQLDPSRKAALGQ